MKAVVIGSGFGGLAAAVRLRSRGYEMTLVEALDRPGGRARVIEQDGFTFDAGPTVITAPYLLHDLFELTGRDSRDYFELVPVDPFYRIRYADGSHFDHVGDEARLLRESPRRARRNSCSRDDATDATGSFTATTRGTQRVSSVVSGGAASPGCR